MNHLKKYVLALVVISIALLLACKPHQAGLQIDRHQTKMPVKVLFGAQYKDSVNMFLMIPQEFQMTNHYPNKIRLSRSYIRIFDGGGSGRHPLFSMADSLVSPPGKTSYSHGEGDYFKVYAGYFMRVPLIEKDSLIAMGKFAQIKSKSPVYDIGSLTEAAPYLNQKIADSLKVFIRLSCYNFENRQGFVEDVPIRF